MSTARNVAPAQGLGLPRYGESVSQQSREVGASSADSGQSVTPPPPFIVDKNALESGLREPEAAQLPPRDVATRANLTEGGKIVHFRKRTDRPRQRSIVLKQWEGVVLEVRQDSFRARLRDKTDPTSPEEEAVIGFDELSEDDKELVAPGRVFYWSVSFRVQAHGARATQGVVRFRRLGVWTKKEIERVKSAASKWDFLLASDAAGSKA